MVIFAGRLQKAGNKPSECEDYACSATWTFAVADGASEASYSHVWAEIIAKRFCRSDPLQWVQQDLAEWVNQCRRAWSGWEGILRQRDLPWFAREKLQAGSFAAIVGLSFSRTGDGTWQAVAYGDSCAFWVRNDELHGSFPLHNSSDFGISPPLLSTNTSSDVHHPAFLAGSAQVGDRVYLATDAIAQWFLRDYERNGKPWIVFDGIGSRYELELMARDYRATGDLRNDDIALIALEVIESSE
jgi:hypothetical protein